jgi:DNA helicase-2/ATP-dependent DNA helicase PcrA
MVHAVEFFQRREVKDVLAYLALLNNPRDDVAFLRVINTPRRGIGPGTIKRLTEYANSKRSCLLDAAREAGLIESLPTRAAVDVAKFVALFDRLSLLAMRPVEEILGHVLSESGYQQQLVDSEAPEDQERLANIEELLTAAREFDEHNPGEGHLEEFLEEVSLVSDTDAWEADNDRVTLMTLHAAKGLEFPVVFIIGLEQGLIPHERSMQDTAQLEEERRLLFVGITRAREELQLSRAFYRDYRGVRKMTVPSPFLMELPREEMEVVEPAAPAPPPDWTPDVHPEHDWDSPEPVVTIQRNEEADAGIDYRSGIRENSASGLRIPRPVADDRAKRADESEFSRIPLPGGLGDDATQSALAGDGRREPSSLRITTAAALNGDAPSSAADTSPESFHQGMAVVHPEYGLGKIVALSGRDDQRRATVSFATEAGQRTFFLKQSPLRPAKR